MIFYVFFSHKQPNTEQIWTVLQQHLVFTTIRLSFFLKQGFHTKPPRADTSGATESRGQNPKGEFFFASLWPRVNFGCSLGWSQVGVLTHSRLGRVEEVGLEVVMDLSFLGERRAALFLFVCVFIIIHIVFSYLRGWGYITAACFP